MNVVDIDPRNGKSCDEYCGELHEYVSPRLMSRISTYLHGSSRGQLNTTVTEFATTKVNDRIRRSFMQYHAAVSIKCTLKSPLTIAHNRPSDIIRKKAIMRTRHQVPRTPQRTYIQTIKPLIVPNHAARLPLQFLRLLPTLKSITEIHIPLTHFRLPG